jgi:lipopolysaccharide/colanic/teichoic acid biosynthesis glycosyltransferase
MKRTLDILVAVFGLIVLAPLLLLISLLVKVTSPGPVLFKQERMGRRFRPFLICKFRTMVADAPQRGKSITVGDDSRITSIGKILRKTKLDELPQLINVLKGDMSLVGPRPEVRQYVEMFRADYEEVLRVRPGVTDLASLLYRDEAALLGQSADPDTEYVTRVLPSKIRLAKEYAAHPSVRSDLMIILRTALVLLGVKSALPDSESHRAAPRDL